MAKNLGNICFGKAGWAEGTNATTIKTAAAVDYTINGIFYSKAITDNIAFTATAVQAVSTTCLYLFSADSAGAITVTKGVEVLTAELTAGATGLHWPVPPANQAVLGAVKVVTNASTTFTGGTTDLGAAGITDTYYDLMARPADNLAS